VKTATLCHKGKTVTVPQSTVKARLARGDTLGPCKGVFKPPAHKLIGHANPHTTG
jgi:hypothetical protein